MKGAPSGRFILIPQDECRGWGLMNGAPPAHLIRSVS